MSRRRVRCLVDIADFTGLFGVPLEILVERTGSDTQLGATSAQLRVPEFIDDIVSAMKQMGKVLAQSKLTYRHVSGGYLQKERQHPPSERSS